MGPGRAGVGRTESRRADVSLEYEPTGGSERTGLVYRSSRDPHRVPRLRERQEGFPGSHKGRSRAVQELDSRVAQLVLVDLGDEPARGVEIVQGTCKDDNFIDFARKKIRASPAAYRKN